MKPISIAFLLGGVFLASCTKVSSSSSFPQTGLTVSSSSLDKGQPLVVTAPSTVTGGIAWSVSPSNLTHVTPGNGQAIVLFGQPGTYQVTGAYALNGDSASSTATVTVSDSAYTPPVPVTWDTTSLVGDVITLTPVIDSNAQLIFIAQTGKSYYFASTMIYGVTAGPAWVGGLSVSFYGLVTAGNGTGGYQNPAVAYLFLDNLNKPADGTYALTVSVSGIQYTGSITVAGGVYTFNWNYTTGVVISPLQVGQ
jgi:hypothetical protein